MTMTTRCPYCGRRFAPPELRPRPQPPQREPLGYMRPIGIAWAFVIVIGFSVWSFLGLYLWKWLLAPG